MPPGEQPVAPKGFHVVQSAVGGATGSCRDNELKEVRTMQCSAVQVDEVDDANRRTHIKIVYCYLANVIMYPVSSSPILCRRIRSILGTVLERQTIRNL